MLIHQLLLLRGQSRRLIIIHRSDLDRAAILISAHNSAETKRATATRFRRFVTSSTCSGRWSANAARWPTAAESWRTAAAKLRGTPATTAATPDMHLGRNSWFSTAPRLAWFARFVRLEGADARLPEWSARETRSAAGPARHFPAPNFDTGPCPAAVDVSPDHGIEHLSQHFGRQSFSVDSRCASIIFAAVSCPS